MPTLDAEFEALRTMLKEYEEAVESLKSLTDKPSEWAFSRIPKKQEVLAEIRAEIDAHIKTSVIRYPYFHEAHFPHLKGFHEGGAYDKSVFIMTKYRQKEDDPESKQLREIIALVQKSVSDNKHAPRLPSDRTFHELLWQNVELYTLGSCRGIAIVEDKFLPSLNPNVAMEWGWMRAMHKPVLFLMEEPVEFDPADWKGLMHEKFSWAEPQKAIPDAVKSYFEKTKVDL